MLKETSEQKRGENYEAIVSDLCPEKLRRLSGLHEVAVTVESYTVRHANVCAPRNFWQVSLDI